MYLVEGVAKFCLGGVSCGSFGRGTGSGRGIIIAFGGGTCHCELFVERGIVFYTSVSYVSADSRNQSYILVELVWRGNEKGRNI